MNEGTDEDGVDVICVECQKLFGTCTYGQQNLETLNGKSVCFCPYRCWADCVECMKLFGPCDYGQKNLNINEKGESWILCPYRCCSVERDSEHTAPDYITPKVAPH